MICGANSSFLLRGKTRKYSLIASKHDSLSHNIYKALICITKVSLTVDLSILGSLSSW